jgi:prepilin-type N-terminal cleavage/methylation domain-containing protein
MVHLHFNVPRVRRACGLRAGVTLLELIVSVAIVGVTMAAAMAAAGVAAQYRLRTLDASFGAVLASHLMDEILSKGYGSTGGGAIGAVGHVVSRAGFTTIDEYHGLVDDPPSDAGGTEIDGATGWRRVVEVERVLADAPETGTHDETGVKRVHVTVFRNGRPAASVTALRTAALDGGSN